MHAINLHERGHGARRRIPSRVKRITQSRQPHRLVLRRERRHRQVHPTQHLMERPLRELQPRGPRLQPQPALDRGEPNAGDLRPHLLPRRPLRRQAQGTRPVETQVNQSQPDGLNGPPLKTVRIANASKNRLLSRQVHCRNGRVHRPESVQLGESQPLNYRTGRQSTDRRVQVGQEPWARGQRLLHAPHHLAHIQLEWEPPRKNIHQLIPNLCGHPQKGPQALPVKNPKLTGGVGPQGKPGGEQRDAPNACPVQKTRPDVRLKQ